MSNNDQTQPEQTPLDPSAQETQQRSPLPLLVGFSVVLLVVVVALFLMPGLFKHNKDNFHSSDDHHPSTTVASNAGTHCAEDSIIINTGNVSCDQASKLSTSNFDCTTESETFYTLWCTSGENSFFSAGEQAYSAIPTTFSHFVQDPSRYNRSGRPGIAFWTEDKSVECLILNNDTTLLLCSGYQAANNNSDIPKNTAVMNHSDAPRLASMQSNEFSYANNLVLPHGSSLMYGGYACSATESTVTCVTITSPVHSFTLSRTAWQPH